MQQLADFIDTQHLSPDAQSTYKNFFFCHEMRLLQIDNFLRPDIAEKVSKCLHSEVEWEQLYGLKHRKPHDVEKETFFEVDDTERFFTFKRCVGATLEHSNSENATAYTALCQALSEQAICDYLSEVTRVAIDSATTEVTTHAYAHGDYLRTHSDTDGNRRLAFIVYLTPNWTAEQGGALHIIGHDLTEIEIQATFNRFVVFDVMAHREHFIAPITTQDTPRLTIGGWFHQKV